MGRPHDTASTGGRARLSGSVLVVLGAVGSVELGQALGKGLLDVAGPLGVAAVRLGLAALVMLALWRPKIPRDRHGLGLVAALGVAIAGMNVSYLAMARLPFGVAMTLQLLGPIAVALVTSRRRRELGWAALAAGSVLLFSDPWSLTGRPPVAGLAFGLFSGVSMAAFLLISRRVATRTAGGGTLALATTWAALLYLPLGLADSGVRLAGPRVLAVGAVVAVLSVVVAYGLTVTALRRLPVRLVGVLLSVEPAVAGFAGLVVLGEHLSVPQWSAILGITVASVGATWSSTRPRTPYVASGDHAVAETNIRQRESLLAEAQIGILSVVESPQRAPLVTPVWCAYGPGDVVRFCPESDVRTLEAVRKAGWATLTVLDGPAPRRFVSVEGSVLISEPTDPDELRYWAAHFLGDTSGQRYYHRVEDDLEHMTTVRLRPHHWRTCDIAVPAPGFEDPRGCESDESGRC